MFWFKKKEREKVNVGKAIAKVEMLSGIERTITVEGYIKNDNTIFNGTRLMLRMLNDAKGLLLDDKGKFFPVNQIKELTVVTEDYFI